MALFQQRTQAEPGLIYSDLNDEQRELVQNVTRTLIDPFRKEDGDEVMELLKSNGGIEKLHLAFYKDEASDPNERWHYWRLEGPAFVPGNASKSLMIKLIHYKEMPPKKVEPRIIAEELDLIKIWIDSQTPPRQ